MDLLLPSDILCWMGLDKEGSPQESRHPSSDEAQERIQNPGFSVRHLRARSHWIRLPEETGMKQQKFIETDCRQCRGRGKWQNSISGMVELCQWCKVPESNPVPGPEWRDEKHLERVRNRLSGKLNPFIRNRGGLRGAYKYLSRLFSAQKAKKALEAKK